ncbi:MAG: hypothetical protein IJO46_01480 [Thermoguttaceae bacterium]|nr:hypothetical protein [Thermoguttaceae bacterium]
MTNVFWFCAILGSTLVALQFVATLLGLGGDMDGDGTPDALDGDFDVGGDADAAEVDVETQDVDGGLPFLKALTLRTVTAGVAFFGLGGLAGDAAELGRVATLATAFGAGVAAIVAVYFLLRTLSSFSADGSLRRSTAVGAVGTVYLRIPPSRSGQGKATVTQQERSVEYIAETDDEDGLPTGTPIVVVKLLGPSTALVARR